MAGGAPALLPGLDRRLGLAEGQKRLAEAQVRGRERRLHPDQAAQQTDRLARPPLVEVPARQHLADREVVFLFGAWRPAEARQQLLDPLLDLPRLVPGPFAHRDGAELAVG